jgi:hypothetical protein
MKIAAANVQLASRHTSEMSAAVSESLTVTGRLASAQASRQTALDAVRISAARALGASSLKSAEKPEESSFELSDEDKLKIKLIEEFMRQLTGKDFKIRIPDKLIREDGAAAQPQGASAPQGSGSSGWGIVYNKTVAMTQSESTAFKATALLTTEDGRQISTQISLALIKSFTAAENTTIRLGDAKAVDPLVLNFAAASASASNTKFAFDLNVDGKTEQISFVGPGSGILALDRNGDGFINNGDELFGPQSGNGFDDLSKLDGDRNQWIDENDDVYDRLQIWVKDESGSDRLFALADKGIGAIYLGNVETPFTLGGAGSVDATIRRTGIFVREDGTAGTIQHVDMVV